jgi:penicillin-binding protein 2
MAKTDPKKDIFGLSPITKIEYKDNENWAYSLSPDSAGRELDELLPKNIYYYFIGLMIIVVTILVSRLFYLQIVKSDTYRKIADGNKVRTNTVPAPRGQIYDSRGSILASNEPRESLAINMNEFPLDTTKREEILSKLETVIKEKIDRNLILDAIKSQQKQVLIKEDLQRNISLYLQQEQSDLTGVQVVLRPIRKYNHDDSLSHVMGYTGLISEDEKKERPNYGLNDFVGKLGLEKSFEFYLKGKDGQERVEVDANSNVVKVLSSINFESGANLKLTIDNGLQTEVAKIVGKWANAGGGQRGSAVVLDSKTGAIKAAVNVPNYNNNLFAQGISSSDYTRLSGDKNSPLYNRYAQGLYPIGSTIKPFVAAIGLDNKVITPQTTITDNARLDIVNPNNSSDIFTFKGWNDRPLGPLNVSSAITLSSDIFFYTLGGGYKNFKGIGVDKLSLGLKTFGFGQNPDIDTNDAAIGVVPDPAYKETNFNTPWSIGDTYNMSIGQGYFLASPLQLALATNTIASHGKLYKPYLVDAVTDNNGAIINKFNPKVVKDNLISPSNEKVITEAMKKVGQIAGGPYKIAGKTGTAETIVSSRLDSYTFSKPHAWFTSFAPYDNPEITVVVLIEFSGEGSQIAMPAAKEIYDYYFTHK